MLLVVRLRMHYSADIPQAQHYTADRSFDVVPENGLDIEDRAVVE